MKTTILLMVRYCLLLAFVLGTCLSFPMQRVEAQGLSYPAEINKTFTPISIIAGGQSVLRVTVFNPNDFALVLEDPGWTDTLPSAVHFDGTPTTNCAGVGTITTSGQDLVLSGYTVPARSGGNPGQCYVEVPVTAVAGTHINTINANVLDAYDPTHTIPVTNTTPASATLTVGVVQPPSLVKTYSPLTTMWAGQTTNLTVRITNNDTTTALTETALSDTLLPGLFLVSGPTSACGGTVTYPDGADNTIVGTTERTITLSGGVIPASTNCSIVVVVSSATQGSYLNTIPAGPSGEGSITTRQGVTNASPASATLNVQSIGLTKAYSPTTVVAGQTSTLTITLQNPTGTPYANANIADTLNSNLVIAASPAVINNCGGTLTANPGESSFGLIGGTIPASTTPPTPVGSCTIIIPVTTASLNSPNATYSNTIAAGDLTSSNGGSNPADVSASLTVQTALTGTKIFSPATLIAGNPATVTITLRNYRNIPLSGVTFTDTLPTNMTVVGTPATPQCGGGTVSHTSTSVTLTNGTIGANTTCTITFQVTSTVSTTYTNTIPANDISTGQGVGNYSTITSNTISVVSTAPPIGVAKSFNPTSISPGVSSRLRITLTAPSDTGLTGITFTDFLPAGLTFFSTPASPQCGGGTVSTTANSFTLTNGSIAAAGGTCTIDVYVTSTIGGQYLNNIPSGSVSGTPSIGGTVRTNTASPNATLNVTTFTMAKSFFPTTVNPLGISTLVITLTNAGPEAITNVYINDQLPNASSPTRGARIANPPYASTTCAGGVVTFPDGGDGPLGANERTIRMTGGTIPAQVGGTAGTCTITVDVQGWGGQGNLTNTITTANAYGTISSGTVNAQSNASAVLTIGSLTIRIVKGFKPELVYGGSDSTLSIELINPNSVPLTGIAFTDNMPAGMLIAEPANPDEGDCGGALDAQAGESSFSFTGGYLPASSSCTLTLRATMTVIANLTNTIPAGAVTTYNGVSSPDPVAASLTNLAGASLSKSFADDSITAGAGNYSLLTILIKNINTVPLSMVGLIDVLPGGLPDGLIVAGPPAPGATTDCGAGVVTAVPGTQNIRLSNGSIAASATCKVVVPVTSTVAGTYTNTIPEGTLTNQQGITNTDPTEDTLVVNAAPPEVPVTDAEELPGTGFAPGLITRLPEQPASLLYSGLNVILDIPALNQRLTVVGVPFKNGKWDVTWLGTNAGYLEGTAFPTFTGNTAITAHVWDANNQPGPFTDLKTLKYGDTIHIDTFGKTYVYEVRENKQVLASDTNAILKHEAYDWLTLLTCEYYNPQNEDYAFRRMVRAVLLHVE